MISPPAGEIRAFRKGNSLNRGQKSRDISPLVAVTAIGRQRIFGASAAELAVEFSVEPAPRPNWRRSNRTGRRRRCCGGPPGCTAFRAAREMRGVPRPRLGIVAQTLPVDMPDHRRALSAARPVVAGLVLTRREGSAVGLRAGQRVVPVGGVPAAVDHIPLLGERRLLGQVVVIAVQIVDILGDDRPFGVLPRTLADAVPGVDRRLPRRLGC